MKSMNRIFGLILVCVAAASLLLSVYGVVQIWQIRQPVTNDIISGVALISDTVKTTADGLVMIDVVLTTTKDNVSLLQSSSTVLATSMHDASSMVTSISQLTGTDIPQTISNTQTSFVSAQASAKIIESVLTAVTQIPFFPGGPYKPDTLLSVALGQTADSLGKLPPALRSISSQLQTTSTNLKSVENQINVFNASMDQVQQNLKAAQKVVDDYKHNVKAIQARLAILQNQIPGWVRSLTWALMFVVVWLVIIQADLLLRALKMMRGQVVPSKPPVN